MFGRFNIIKTNLEVSSKRLAVEAVALSNHEDMKRLMQEQQERFVSEVKIPFGTPSNAICAGDIDQGGKIQKQSAQEARR